MRSPVFGAFIKDQLKKIDSKRVGSQGYRRWPNPFEDQSWVENAQRCCDGHERPKQAR